ncbi:MAG: YggT family protein [Acidimicrobiia bacterium]|nr:YggT family protein [Acidimicrobiia bacterium]
MKILCVLINLYLVVLVLRAVLSWFPVRPGTGMAAVSGVLRDMTEPLLRPLRSLIPPAGMFDLSFMVLFIGLLVVQSYVCGL